MIRYYDRKGNPLENVLAWAELYEQDDYRRIERTELRPGLVVSTVWQGIDTDLGRYDDENGNPPIFETAVLMGNRMGDVVRTRTEEAAREAHARFVEVLTEEDEDDAEGNVPT